MITPPSDGGQVVGHLAGLGDSDVEAEFHQITTPCNTWEVTTPRRCAIYLRVSLDATGEQLAVQRQRADCLRIADQRGWNVVGEFVDNSVSASDKHKARPEYDQLVAAYEAGEFDALVCWDLDRLTCQPRQLEDWIDAAQERGLLLVTANGEADLSNDGGRMFARIKATVARSEIERKSARQRAAALQRAEHGKPPLGVRLTGYTPSGDVIETEGAIVRQLFDRFAAGDSLRALAAWLTETGVSTRHGRPWNPSSVRTILTNPRYAGHAVYQGKTNGKLGTWKAVVDDDVFRLVETKLADPRRKTQQGTDRKHLGAGLFECGKCDAKVRSWSGDRYRCPNGCLTRAQHYIDDLVIKTIRERLGRADLADLITPKESKRAEAASAELKRLTKRLERIEADYDSGDIDGPRYKVSTQKVKAELAEAQRVLARLSTRSAAASTLSAPDPVAAFDAAPLMIRRNVVDAVSIVKIAPTPRGRKTFDPNSVSIKWREDLD
ncbi:recombinase family protein [Amycolatopsis sp. NBC_01488]|uniref:recombinase family protein n=1 Tax=Amycolatopsis sp. NBC_01488 TaxID=2903563 RepID=UPI002E2C2451|nr:recombinase family protein [Amycolatopsis sp. NBC_01488]